MVLALNLALFFHPQYKATNRKYVAQTYSSLQIHMVVVCIHFIVLTNASYQQIKKNK